MNKNPLKYFVLLLLLAVAMPGCDGDLISTDAGRLPDGGAVDNPGGILRSMKTLTDRVPVNLTEGEETVAEFVYYMLTKPAKTAVTVKVTADEKLVEAYNKANKTNLKPFPAANVQPEGGGVLTIAAGQQKSQEAKITISTKGLEPGSVYLLPLTVAQTPEGMQAQTGKQTLYYGVNIRKIDVSNMPLNTDFLTVLYLNTEEYQPLLADVFAVQKQDFNTFEIVYEETVGNIVNLRMMTVGYQPAGKRALLSLGNDIRYVLENADKYIRPLQDHGRKVCICIQGGGKGIGFCNMTDSQIADFTAQVKEVVTLYRLDGVNLWDEGSAYGKEGMPLVNTTSYPKLIKSLREAMPGKLLTLTDKGEPTGYFYDAALCGGIKVGEWIDYAWSGYNESDEKYQIIDPWDPDHTYSDYARKPIAGMTPDRYGCIAVPLYPVKPPEELVFSIERIYYWRLAGMKRNNILVTHDLITRYRSGNGREKLFIEALWYLADDGIDEEFNFLNGYSGMPRYPEAFQVENEFGKWVDADGTWKKDW